MAFVIVFQSWNEPNGTGRAFYCLFRFWILFASLPNILTQIQQFLFSAFYTFWSFGLLWGHNVWVGGCICGSVGLPALWPKQPLPPRTSWNTNKFCNNVCPLHDTPIWVLAYSRVLCPVHRPLSTVHCLLSFCLKKKLLGYPALSTFSPLVMSSAQFNGK